MNSLQYKIKQLLMLAVKNDPEPVKEILEKGLVVNLRIQSNNFVLIIWRLSMFPAASEWNVICASWPWEIELPEYERFKHRKMFYLKGLIPYREIE